MEVCSLGVGCEEVGICYAVAHGQPDRCGVPVVRILALLEGECVELEHNLEAEKWLRGNHYCIVGDEERGTFDELDFDEIIEVVS